MVIAGFLFTLAVLACVFTLIGGKVLMLWDIICLLICLGCIAGSLTAGNLLGDFLRGFKYLFMKTPVIKKGDIQAAVSAFDLAYKSSIAAGFIGMIMGLVIMLVNLSNAEYIWAYMAVCILTVLYGIVLAFALFMPCRSRLMKMAAAGTGSGDVTVPED